MQSSLPIHMQPGPTPPADARLYLGPVCGATYAAAGAAVTAIVCTACATLGATILQAAGKEVANMPGYVDLLVPTLVGTSVVAGGLGFLSGCFSPDARTI